LDHCATIDILLIGFDDYFMANGNNRRNHHAAQFKIRMHAGMHEQIADAAQASGRSMNSEIMVRLEASFAPDPCAELIDIIIGALEAAAADGQIHRFIAAIKERRG
jgi:hypothetical protein